MPDVLTISKLRDAIQDVLKGTPLTSSELRTRLFSRSIRVPEYEILKDLRLLQNEGTVSFEMGRWHIRTFIKTPAINDQFSKPSRNLVQQSSHTSAPQTLTHWSPSQCQSIVEAISSQPEDVNKKDNLKQQNFSGAWGAFRKLLGYYSDCVRNDEGCEASAYLQDQGKRFIHLRQFGSWYPKAGKPWAIKIPMVNVLQGFAKNLSILGESGVLVLGYPLQVWSKPEAQCPEDVFIKPIFTYQLSAVSQGDYFLISCDEPWPEVNLDWLSYALKQPDHQRAFLSSCGLMDRGQGDESVGDGSRLADAADLKILAAGVTMFFGERIREPLRPESLSSLDFSGKPMSGIYNRAVLMIGNRTRYARSLLKELAHIASFNDEQLDQTALRFIFKSSEQKETLKKTNPESMFDVKKNANGGTVLEVTSLNGEQRQCIASFLNQNLTVVTGPPGTGKSQVVSAAMANARIKNQTVLFSSRNHKAIDAVVERLILDNQKSLVIRANSKEDSFLKFGFEAAITQLLGEEYDQRARDSWKGIYAKLSELLLRRGEYSFQSEEIQRLRDSLGKVEQQIDELITGWSTEMLLEIGQHADEFPTKFILMLEKEIGSYRFKNSITFWEKIKGLIKSYRLRAETESLRNFMKKNCPHWPGIPKHEGFLGLRELSLKLPLFLSTSKYCELKKATKPIEEQLKGLPSIETIVGEVKKSSDVLEEMIPMVLNLELARRTGLPPDADRETLAALRSALRGLDQPVSDEDDRKATRAALESYSPFLLEHFPLWAVTNLAVGSRFPLVPGLFDLAVIDEASQCDIASALPILFRAKRVGVVGDPQQLSHVTKIKGTRDALLRKRHNITQMNNEQRFSYPDTSLYDLFAQTNGVYPVMLKETYRSIAEIAEYSNHSFYGGTLRVMTAAHRLRVPRHMKSGIHWTEIVSNIHSAGPHGCVAPEEVKEIVEILKKLLIENSFEGTVGVVTPFVQQKLRLNDAIAAEIPIELRRNAKLLIDTAHGFQGDERDVMLLSLCAGPSMPPGSMGFIRKTANLMNVAVSRARAVLHVIGNKSWAAKSGIPHLVNLAIPPKVQPVRNNPFQSQWHPHESPWEKILYDALKVKGIVAEPQHPVLGRRLDLALIGRGEACLKVDIEVDGDRYHRNADGTRKNDDVWRDIQLQASGWKVMRFWVYQLREDLEGCVNKIIKIWR